MAGCIGGVNGDCPKKVFWGNLCSAHYRTKKLGEDITYDVGNKPRTPKNLSKANLNKWKIDVSKFWSSELNGGIDWKDLNPLSQKESVILSFKDDTGTDYTYKFKLYTLNTKYSNETLPPHTWTPTVLIRGVTDLKTINPNLAEEFVSSEDKTITDPSNILPGSSKKCVWKCKNILHPTFVASPSNRHRNNTRCDWCTTNGVSILSEIPEIASIWSNKNTETPNQIRSNSQKKVYLECTNHPDIPFYIRVKQYKRTKKCNICSGKVGYPGNSLGDKYPWVIDRWADSNSYSPFELRAKTNKTILLTCKNHPEISPSEYTPSTWKNDDEICFICSGKRVHDGVNSLRHKFPSIADEYSNKNKLNSDEIHFGSNLKVWWTCSSGHEWFASVCGRTGSREHGCPICTHGFNKTSLINVLDSISKTFNDLNKTQKLAVLQSCGVATKVTNSSYSKDIKMVLDDQKTLSEVLEEWKSEDSDTTPETEDSPVEEEFTSGLEGLEEDNSDLLMGVGGADALMSEDELDAQIHGIGEALDKGRTGVGKADELVEFLISSFVAEKWKAEFAK